MTGEPKGIPRDLPFTLSDPKISLASRCGELAVAAGPGVQEGLWRTLFPTVTYILLLFFSDGGVGVRKAGRSYPVVEVSGFL